MFSAATRIEQAPATIDVNQTNDVTLRCDVHTDPAEPKNLHVEWRKNGVAVDYNKEIPLEAEQGNVCSHHQRLRG